MYTLVDTYGFLAKFAKRQAHGSMTGFVRKMAQLGEGLAPSGLFSILEQRRTVICDFDLTGTGQAELQALAHAAQTSTMPRELEFTKAEFLQKMFDGEEVNCRNFVRFILRAPRLEVLTFGPGIQQQALESIAGVVREEMPRHPTLRSVRIEGYEEILRTRTEDGTLLKAAREGDVACITPQALEASPDMLPEALATACALGHWEAVRALLAEAPAGPAHAATAELEHWAPLHVAAMWQQAAPAGVLLCAGLDFVRSHLMTCFAVSTCVSCRSGSESSLTHAHARQSSCEL